MWEVSEMGECGKIFQLCLCVFVFVFCACVFARAHRKSGKGKSVNEFSSFSTFPFDKNYIRTSFCDAGIL